MTDDLPILYSFRRCPYAMRARLAIHAAGFRCHLREVVLRDKPPELLLVSPKGTVPVLVLADGSVLQESLEIMRHVLRRNDPEDWLPGEEVSAGVRALIRENDGPFKAHLDRTKYPDRYPDEKELDWRLERAGAMAFVSKLDNMLQDSPFLFGDRPTLADFAILPFIRQFAHIELDWFRQQPVNGVHRWLDRFLASARFQAVMVKYEKWRPDQPPVPFPGD